MVRLVSGLMVVLVLTQSASALDRFVNNLTGSDLNDGSTPQPTGQYVGPVRSITKALRIARKGDRIVIANTGQPYRESLTLQAGRNSGYADSPFLVEGNGAVLDGTAPVPEGAWEHVNDHVFRFQPQRTGYQQLFRDGRPLARAAAGPDDLLPELEPLEWCLHEGYVYLRTEAGRLPDWYELTHTHLRVGITLYQVRHVIVQDLVVEGFQLDGVNCHSNVHGGALVGLTCRGNGRSGVSIGGASRATLAASLLHDNGTAQLRVEGFARVETINNNLLPDSAPAIVNEGATVLNVDPSPADADDESAAPPQN